MSLMAVVMPAGVGTAMFAAYRCPVTSGDVENSFVESRDCPNPVRKVSAAGLTPTWPTMEVVPVVETPVLARITKDAAVPRSIAPGAVELLLVANAAPTPPGAASPLLLPPPPPPHPAIAPAKASAVVHMINLLLLEYLVILLPSFSLDLNLQVEALCVVLRSVMFLSLRSNRALPRFLQIKVICVCAGAHSERALPAHQKKKDPRGSFSISCCFLWLLISCCRPCVRDCRACRPVHRWSAAGCPGWSCPDRTPR